MDRRAMLAPECEAFGADGTFKNGQRRVDSGDFIPNGHTISLFVHSVTQRKKRNPTYGFFRDGAQCIHRFVTGCNLS